MVHAAELKRKIASKGVRVFCSKALKTEGRRLELWQQQKQHLTHVCLQRQLLALQVQISLVMSFMASIPGSYASSIGAGKMVLTLIEMYTKKWSGNS
eukprot:CAMPEP_0184318250 /NCGR_PEP_ID=MMETSP1049-20130417/101531_1 /TAXON_ID=77928 /ORGANISM="Proteomonas sulcata, Strain CCMP704" /LENGTH=96 /DNA_ID=CAMNT_0026637951 /DNA_START=51 /DNA_END=341 /DNA_ORIENTATION=+